MSKITDIKLQKNKKRANIYVDGAFYCGLLAETALQNGLKPGTEISRDALAKIQETSEKAVIFEKALKLLSRKPYTVYEIKQKLREKGYLSPSIDGVVERLKEYKYLDDAGYAEMLVSYGKRNKSKLLLKQKMITRGLHKDIIEEQLKEVTEEDEVLSAMLVANKYMKGKITDAKSLSKLYAYLYSKGYSSSVIKECICGFKPDDVVWEE